MKNKLVLLVFSLVISLSAGAIGAIFTQVSMSSWYVGLIKPGFNPPNWVFSPVWTVLYVLIGLALFLILSSDLKLQKKETPLVLFFAQWLLNILWPFFFFFLESPMWGFVGIIVLFVAIIFTKIYFYKINRLAGYLLIPYALWVAFAAILNYFIWQMN